MFWSGPTPGWAIENVAAWREFHDVHLWCDEPELEEIAGLAFETADRVCEADHVRHAASLVRWWALYTYGGVWVDCDVSPLKALDIPLDRPFVSCFGDFPIPCVTGGPKGHPLWLELIEGARVNRGTSPHVSGCHPLDAAMKRHDVLRLPAGSFIDRDSNGRAVAKPPGGRYSTHAWATSSTRKDRKPCSTCSHSHEVR